MAAPTPPPPQFPRREELSARIIELETATTELRRLQNALKESEEKYRNTFEYTGTAMMVLNEDMTLSMGNHKMEEITGYSQSELLLKKQWTEYIADPQDIERMHSYFTQRMADPSSVPTEYEFALKTKNGSVRDMIATVSMIPGTPKRLVSLLDNTQRKKMLEQLQQSERRFKQIAELLPGIICEMDKNLNITYVNQRGLSSFELTPQDLLQGVNGFDFIAESHRAKAIKDITNVLSGDYGNPQEYELKTRSGRLLHVLMNSSPVVNEGQISGIRTCIIDITDLKIAQAGQRTSEERFQQIFTQSPIGIALFASDNTWVKCNRAFEQLFGPAQTSDLFDSFVSLSSREKELLLSGRTITTETTNSPDAGTARYFSWNISLLSEGNNTFITLAQVIEVTELKALEEARYKKMRDQADAATQRLEAITSELLFKSTFSSMVSRSPQMQTIFDILPEIAAAPATLLVLGESGTGKELVARALHELSPRAKGPFIAVNCGAVPDALLESELFGYAAGAFTDAKKDKSGKIAAAEGGTLFLDEIGDISMSLQVKLLRFLQEKTYEPLGDTRTRNANVRVVTATNRDLVDMIKKGTFREDLYYRINVLTINLPALRDRRCDIPLLCDHFIRRFNNRYSKNISRISSEALDLLLTHPFDGNIRELENILEHAFIFCKDSIIAPTHLPSSLCGPIKAPQQPSFASIKDLKELEREFIKSVLIQTGNNKQKAAQHLGIHKTTLFRKLKELDIPL